MVQVSTYILGFSFNMPPVHSTLYTYAWCHRPAIAADSTICTNLNVVLYYRALFRSRRKGCLEVCQWKIGPEKMVLGPKLKYWSPDWIFRENWSVQKYFGPTRRLACVRAVCSCAASTAASHTFLV